MYVMHLIQRKWASLLTGYVLNVAFPNWSDFQYFVRNVHHPNCYAIIPYTVRKKADNKSKGKANESTKKKEQKRY